MDGGNREEIRCSVRKFRIFLDTFPDTFSEQTIFFVTNKFIKYI